MPFQPIPIIRIFDEAMAKTFYLDFLAMSLDRGDRMFEIVDPISNRILFNEHTGT